MRQDLKNMNKKFKTVVLGGTFDHLHKGHKEFIRLALFLSEKVIVGLTSDEYIGNSKFKIQNSKLENFEERKDSLENFLNKEQALNRVKIFKIEDVFGITLDKEFDVNAIMVVEKTLKGAESINAKRLELGLHPLEVVIAPSAVAEDGELISSSRIRNGEINREGKLYVNPEWLKQDLTLPESLRGEFKKPFGELIAGDELGIIIAPLVTVGDVTAQKFNRLSLNQKISIIDFNVARKKRFDRISELGFSKDIEIIKVDNPAGQITPELFKAVVEAFSKEGRVIIEVLGEEDLAVLPVILAAPLGAVVFYGQPASPETSLASRGGPDEGVVKIVISEESKKKVYRLLTEFVGGS